MELSYAEYSAGLIHEYEDHIDFYLNNYRVDTTKQKADRIIIYGSTAEPTITWADRGSHEASKVTTTWQDGVYTITATHCGALDLTVNCKGTATDRLSTAELPAVTALSSLTPQMPPLYTGPRQYEAECFDYKSVERVVTRPDWGTVVEGHYGQGYLVMGTNTSAAVKDTVNVPVAGTYRLTFRYQAPVADARHTMLLVNTTAVRSGKRMEFAKTAADEWGTASMDVTLREGDNVVYLRTNSAYGTPQQLLLDNLVVELLQESVINDPVQSVASQSQRSQSVYNLQGQRVDRMNKGLYIINGKKRIIR